MGQLVDDVMSGLATQVPEPDPWTWNVPDPDMPFITSPDPWSDSYWPTINYDPAPLPESSLDPNFFGPYTDPFAIGDYGYGTDDWWSTLDYGYSYDDGATYDYGYSYDSYGYDYSYDSYDYGYDYSYGYSTGGSYGSGGSGSSIYYDDYA